MSFSVTHQCTWASVGPWGVAAPAQLVDAPGASCAAGLLNHSRKPFARGFCLSAALSPDTNYQQHLLASSPTNTDVSSRHHVAKPPWHHTFPRNLLSAVHLYPSPRHLATANSTNKILAKFSKPPGRGPAARTPWRRHGVGARQWWCRGCCSSCLSSAAAGTPCIPHTEGHCWGHKCRPSLES